MLKTQQLKTITIIDAFNGVLKKFTELIVDKEKYVVGGKDFLIIDFVNKRRWLGRSNYLTKKIWYSKRLIHYWIGASVEGTEEQYKHILDEVWETILHEIAHLNPTPHQYSIILSEMDTPITKKIRKQKDRRKITKNHNEYFWNYLNKLHKRYDCYKEDFEKDLNYIKGFVKC